VEEELLLDGAAGVDIKSIMDKGLLQLNTQKDEMRLLLTASANKKGGRGCEETKTYP
jgi:hypothetical protein